MKIKINYDLLDKIAEAKTGFSLDRNTRHILPRVTLASAIYSLLNITDPKLFDKLLYIVPLFFTFYALPTTIDNAIMLKKFKELSIQELKTLSMLLSDINIKTHYKLLLDSYKYKTEYEINFSESKIPYVKQDKYINVPVYNDGEIIEVSLVQEHIIGSKKYYLSYGSPKKVLKPAFSSI